MKKVISLILAALLLTATCSVAFSAYSVVDEGAESAAEAVAAFEAEEGVEYLKARVYFLMPNGTNGPAATTDVSVHRVDEDPDTGEVNEYDEVVIHAGEKASSWLCDYNILPEDGKHYAGVYWWKSGLADPDAWAGYRMEIADEAQSIYYVDLPCSEDLTTIIFNNGVDGGMDKDQPVYPWAYQTANLNCEGAGPDEYDTLPEGTPLCDDDSDLAYSFHDCIAVVNPDSATIQPDSGRIQAGVNWYVYYGDGCYGLYPRTSDNFTSVEANCVNPDHFKNGVHVGYQGGGEEHTHTIQHVDTVYSTTEHAGVKAHYECTGCGKLFTDEAGENETTLEELTTPIFVPQEGYFYFDTANTGWDMSVKNSTIAFHVFGGDIAKTNSWGAKKTRGALVEGTEGTYGIQASKLGFTYTEGVQYKIIFIQISGGNPASQTYDLLFDSTCLGKIAYADGTMTENPVDSSKKTLTAYWRGVDPTEFGPVLQISSIGNVVGSCPEAGRTPESIFVDWLTVVTADYGTTGYQNAMDKVVAVGTKTEQQLIDDIGTGLGFTKQQVYDAFTQNEVENGWDYTVSTLPGDVVLPHVHTPAEPVQENVVPATCKAAGSYDEVVYCSKCGAELSRTKKTIAKLAHTPGQAVRENVVVGHDSTTYDMVTYCTVCQEELSRVPGSDPIITHTLTYVPEVDSTYDKEGMKAHYECSGCDKLFADASGSVEVTRESLIIPKKVVIDGILGDIDNSGEVDIVDVTLIQRADLGIITADAAMIARGDVDKSGAIDITDATRVQRWLVGLNEGFGIGQNIA